MSTAVSTCPNQLCFPWMQSETGSNRARTKPGKIAQARKNPVKRELAEVAAPKESSFSAESPATVSQTLTQVVSQSTNVAERVSPQRDGMRVGQVRIGNVMLSLLKKYGITDQEISDVLSTIAQEKCQGLAG